MTYLAHLLTILTRDMENEYYDVMEAYIMTHMMVNQGFCYLAPILDHYV